MNLSSSNADGGHSVQDSQGPSLVSGARAYSSPSSPTGHNWEMNYQEAAIYLQVSASRSVPGGGRQRKSPSECGLHAATAPEDAQSHGRPCSRLEQESSPGRVVGVHVCVLAQIGALPNLWLCLSPVPSLSPLSFHRPRWGPFVCHTVAGNCSCRGGSVLCSHVPCCCS